MILTHRALGALAAAALISFVNGNTPHVGCVFISYIGNAWENEARRPVHLAKMGLLGDSLILDELLLLCLKRVAPNLAGSIEGVSGGCKHERLLVMVGVSC
jgi:hypothetical protein